MTIRWLGLNASKDTVTVVDAKIPKDESKPIIIQLDSNWKIQSGDRAAAYSVLHQQCTDYLRSHEISCVVIKASAVAGKGSATLGHLLAAEVRGVLLASAGSFCQVKQLTKSHISKTYGDRKMDEYIADDSFWSDHTTGGDIRKMSRETAMLIIAVRNA